MANGSSTNLLQGLAKANQKWQSAEHRPANTAVIATAYNGEIANPELAQLRKREDRPTSFDFINSIAEGSDTLRTALHTGARGDTSRVAVSYQGFVEKFSISLTQYENNTFAFAEVYSTNLKNKVDNLLKRADTWFLAQLVTNITEINTSSLGVLDGGTFIFTIPKEETDYYINNIETMMEDNDYTGRIGIIGDSKTALSFKQQMQQGSANATNLGWQLGNNVFMHTPKEIFAGANKAALSFPLDSVAIIPWIPEKNQNNVSVDKAWTPNGDFARIFVPVMDGEGNVAYTLPIAISQYATRADTSAANGSEQDLLLQVEVSFDLAMAHAPLSAKRGANDTVIYGTDLEPLTI